MFYFHSGFPDPNPENWLEPWWEDYHQPSKRLPDHPLVMERFFKHTQHCHETGCLLWTGGKSRGGMRFSAKALYGTFNPGGVIKGGVRAHIYAAFVAGLIEPTYDQFTGKTKLIVPDGYQVDHKCERSLCVDPWHLQLITSEQNLHYRHYGR